MTWMLPIDYDGIAAAADLHVWIAVLKSKDECNFFVIMVVVAGKSFCSRAVIHKIRTPLCIPLM